MSFSVAFFQLHLTRKPPCGQSGLRKENPNFAGLSIDLIIAENRPAINHVFNRCYKFLNGAQFQKFVGLSGFFYLHHDSIYHSSVSIAERLTIKSQVPERRQSKKFRNPPPLLTNSIQVLKLVERGRWRVQQTKLRPPSQKGSVALEYFGLSKVRFAGCLSVSEQKLRLRRVQHQVAGQ